MPGAPFIIWKAEYSVGVEKLDKQHRKLFEAINRLYWATQDKQEPQIVKGILSELHKYILTHLADEEAIMAACRYPELNAHRLSHLEFIQKTGNLFASYTQKNDDISYDLLLFLKEWWTSHVLKIDQKYVPYVKEYVQKAMK